METNKNKFSWQCIVATVTATTTVIAFLVIQPLKDRIDWLKEQISGLERKMDGQKESLQLKDEIILRLESKVVPIPVAYKDFTKNILRIKVLIAQGTQIENLNFSKIENYQVFDNWRKSGIREIEILNYTLKSEDIKEFKANTACTMTEYLLVKGKIENGINVLKKVQSYLQTKNPKS